MADAIRRGFGRASHANGPSAGGHGHARRSIAEFVRAAYPQRRPHDGGESMGDQVSGRRTKELGPIANFLDSALWIPVYSRAGPPGTRPLNCCLDMQPNGCIIGGVPADMDKVFKARRMEPPEAARPVAFPQRTNAGRTVRAARHERKAVTKHLKLLEEAHLVVHLWRDARNCTFSTRSPSTRSPTAGSKSTSGAGCGRWRSSENLEGQADG